MTRTSPEGEIHNCNKQDQGTAAVLGGGRNLVKAGVRAAVKTVLRKRGVKPEHLEALTKQVIIQAEAMFKEWPLAA